MTAKLNHTIAWVKDRDESALFMSEMLGLDPPVELGHFAAVAVGDELTIDFAQTDGEISLQHYAFLVSEEEFDAVFGRIKARKLDYWADPGRNQPGEINHWDDGRGVYFPDPSGHLLEIITRSYGSAGTEAEHPNPLIASTIEHSGKADSA